MQDKIRLVGVTVFSLQDNQFVIWECHNGLDFLSVKPRVASVSSLVSGSIPIDGSLTISQLLLPMASVNN